MRLSDDQRILLAALQAGDRLKVHRTIDGDKHYVLHRLDETGSVSVDAAMVDELTRSGLIESNMKFPAATFLLTDKGIGVAACITGSAQSPVGPRNFA
jgi:hypothetical protein